MSEEKNCMQHKWSLKKSCNAVRKKQKKPFHDSYIALQNPSEPATIFPCSLLNSIWISGDAAELLLHVSNVLQSTHQEISVVLG